MKLRNLVLVFAPLLILIAVASAFLSRPSSPLNRKIMILGVDGADWDVLDNLIAEGRTPNFKRVAEGGVRAPLFSLEDYRRSPVIWTSIMTGRLPEDHGVEDFTYRDPGTGDLIPVTSSARKVPALWNILTSHRLRTSVIGMWATFPAETITGSMISDRCAFMACKPGPERVLALETQDQLTWPMELYNEIEPCLDPSTYQIPATLRRSLHQIVDLNKTDRLVFRKEFTDFHADDVHYLKQAFQEDYAKLEIGRRILSSTDALSRPQLYINYFRGTDVVQHFFWRYHEPQDFEPSPADPALFGSLVNDYYEFMDDVLGLHLAFLEPEDSLLIVSDHGAMSQTVLQADLYWSNKTHMPRWRSRTEGLYRALGIAQPALGVHEGLAGVTLAGEGGKNNLAFRLEPQEGGPSLPELRQEVVKRVVGIRILPTDRNLFHLAPDKSTGSDLVFSATHLYDIEYRTNLLVQGAEYPMRDLFLLRKRSGDHRREGVFIGYGADFKAGVTLDEVSVLDIAPLTMALFDLPRGVNMPGMPPEEALNRTAMKWASNQTTRDYAKEWSRKQGAGMQDNAMIEQLKGLGYISN